MPDAPHPIQTDERWLQEWIAYGLSELAYYLLKQARFEKYLVDNDRKEAA